MAPISKHREEEREERRRRVKGIVRRFGKFQLARFVSESEIRTSHLCVSHGARVSLFLCVFSLCINRRVKNSLRRAFLCSVSRVSERNFWFWCLRGLDGSKPHSEDFRMLCACLPRSCFNTVSTQTACILFSVCVVVKQIRYSV